MTQHRTAIESHIRREIEGACCLYINQKTVFREAIGYPIDLEKFTRNPSFWRYSCLYCSTFPRLIPCVLKLLLSFSTGSHGARLPQRPPHRISRSGRPDLPLNSVLNRSFVSFSWEVLVFPETAAIEHGRIRGEDVIVVYIRVLFVLSAVSGMF